MWIPKWARDRKKGVETAVPTQVVSNEELIPRPQSTKQKQIEAVIGELAEFKAKKLGMDRRGFMSSSMGLATCFMASNMVWGKNHNANVILTLRRHWGVKTFVTGSGPTKEGHQIVHDALIRLSSWNQVGVVLPINLWKNYTAETMAQEVVPLSSIEV